MVDKIWLSVDIRGSPGVEGTSKQITFQPVGEIMYQRIICLRQSDRWEAATITVMVVTGLC